MPSKQNKNTITRKNIFKNGIYGLSVIVLILSFFGYVYDLGEYVDPYLSSEQKSNLEVNILVTPTTKFSKASDIIFEFNICNIGDTGEQYNYSLKTKNIILNNDSGHIDGNNDYGSGGLNDGEPCKVKEYKILPDKKQLYNSYTYEDYPEISFSIGVYSTSKNKLLLYKSFKYVLEDEAYNLES